MFLKIFGLLIIFMACSFGGVLLGNNFIKRENELKDLERALTELENQILYIHEPLPFAFKSVGERNKGNIKSLFYETSELLSNGEVKDVYNALKVSFEKLNEYLAMKEDDKNLVLNLGKSLGALDKEGHRKIFELCLKELKVRIEESHEESLKNSKMYRCIGISIGLTIIIFLI